MSSAAVTLESTPPDIAHSTRGAGVGAEGVTAGAGAAWVIPPGSLAGAGLGNREPRGTLERRERLAGALGLAPPAALHLVRHHHERWDGSGYPDGLAGEEIPLLAGVFAVIDVYDALVSECPYKRAWTREEAQAE